MNTTVIGQSLRNKIPRKANLYTRYAGEISRDELRSSSSPEYRLLKFGQPEKFRVKRPSTEAEAGLDPGFFGEFCNGKPFVTIFRDGTILGPRNPITLSDSLRVIVEQFGQDRTRLNERIDTAIRAFGPYGFAAEITSSWLSSPVDERYPLATLLPYWEGRSYYHVLFEDVPKVQALECVAAEEGEFPTVLLDPDSPGWMAELLELAGVPPEKLEKWDSSKAAVDQLVVPLHRNKGHLHDLSKAHVEWTRDRLLSAIKPKIDTALPDRIYISREDASVRRVVNENEVMAELEDLGFQRYVLSELTVANQIRLCEQAEAIVGPHGAGISNMVFADDPTVVEIHHPKFALGMFCSIARMFDYEYGCVMGEAVGDNVAITPKEVIDKLE